MTEDCPVSFVFGFEIKGGEDKVRKKMRLQAHFVTFFRHFVIRIEINTQNYKWAIMDRAKYKGI